MESFKVVGLVGFFLSLISMILLWMEVSIMLSLSTTIYSLTTGGVTSSILLIICLDLILTKPGKWEAYVLMFLAFVALVITAAVSRVSEIIEREAIGTAG